MSICVNVRMSKIMHMPIKVGVCMYARYENCWTLLSWWENTEFQSPLFLVFLSPQTLEVTIFKMGWFGPILELKLILLPLFTAGIAGHQCHIQSLQSPQTPQLCNGFSPCYTHQKTSTPQILLVTALDI